MCMRVLLSAGHLFRYRNTIHCACAVVYLRILPYAYMYKLLHVGNADFLAMAETWEQLIEHYTDNNCLIEAKQWKILRDAGVFSHAGRVND